MMEVDLEGLALRLEEIRDELPPEEPVDYKRGCLGMAAECLRKSEELEQALGAEQEQIEDLRNMLRRRDGRDVRVLRLLEKTARMGSVDGLLLGVVDKVIKELKENS